MLLGKAELRIPLGQGGAHPLKHRFPTFPFPRPHSKAPQAKGGKSLATENRNTEIRETLGKFHWKAVGKIFLCNSAHSSQASN